LQAGFAALGFARVRAVDDKHYSLWLQRGYHGDMQWLAKHQHIRAHPQRLFPACQTVISLALPYYSVAGAAASEKNGISIYAQGRDYHRVIAKLLKGVVRKIRTQIDSDFQARIAVDSAPLAEKEWAQISGLGWQGKNGNILNKRLGSYFFLAELLVNRPYPPDEPVADHCGTCRRCLDACPTQAIVADKVVDARRCLSYLTIETKTVGRSAALARQTGGWLFGCDICQRVCPWNRFAVDRNPGDFAPRRALADISPLVFLFMSESEFKWRFQGNSLRRAGYLGMQRNALYALAGNNSTYLQRLADFAEAARGIHTQLYHYFRQPQQFYQKLAVAYMHLQRDGESLFRNWQEYIDHIVMLGEVRKYSPGGEIVKFTDHFRGQASDYRSFLSARLALPEEAGATLLQQRHKSQAILLWHAALFAFRFQGNILEQWLAPLTFSLTQAQSSDALVLPIRLQLREYPKAQTFSPDDE
jgi:epoxyqueuosine reductase